VLYDLDAGRPNPWRSFIENTARDLRIQCVNVLDEMRSRHDTDDLFLQAGTAGGHYSNAGHAVTADALFKRLSEMLPAK